MPVTKTQPSAKLTLSAARYMREEFLVIRNSYTEQLRFVHYDNNPKLGESEGIYSVPLWTIAIPNIPHLVKKEPQQLPRCIEEHFKRISSNSLVYDILDPEISNSSPEQQQRHLDDFLKAIQAFLSDHVSFGPGFFAKAYNYELIVASAPLNTALTDYERYATGGRVSYPIRAADIVYRITFTQDDINFFKAIINKQYDQSIFIDSLPSNPQIAMSIRHALCHRLALEIITTKLVRFLNALGTLKTLIYINKEEREELFNIALEKQKETIQNIVTNGWIAKSIYKDYTLNKEYPTSQDKSPNIELNPIPLQRHLKPLYKKFPNHIAELDKLSSMYFTLDEAKARLTQTNPLHSRVCSLLENIKQWCRDLDLRADTSTHLETTDIEQIALLKLRFARIKAKVQELEITPRLKPSPSTTYLLPPIRPSSSKQISMHILNGFLIALGATAIALSFTVLISTGIAPLVFAAGVVGAGFGFFRMFESVCKEPRVEVASVTCQV